MYTAKFQIFCDEPNQQCAENKDPNNKLSRREPLALRQHFIQEQPPNSQQTQDQDQDQDQENDISIASLGSDFVPSIINGEFDSFECCEDSGTNSEFMAEDDDLNISDDIEIDDDTQEELNRALKKHDESILFNSAVFSDDILDYLHELEAKVDLRPIPNYMLFHHDIDSDKRAILANWLVEVADEFDIQTETLFITINIIDRFLSKMSMRTSYFQLLGVAAMFIASKYEEIYPPGLYSFVDMTDETFSGKQIIQMEQEILRTLDFRISTPTTTYFLRQIFTFNKFTKKVYHLAEYLCHLSLLADQPFLQYLPSEIALAAVILAAHQLDAADSISSDLRSAYDKSNQAQLQRREAAPSSPNSDTFACDNQFAIREGSPFCIEALREMQKRVPHDSAVYIKYSASNNDCVACLPPLSINDLRRIG